MQFVKKEVTEETVFEAICKNAKTGANSIIDLLPRVKDDALRSAMTQQLDGYEKYAARAEQALAERGCKAKGERIVARLSAKMGTAFNTMLDSSSTHIAEMMIEGSNMGITDLTKLLNHFEVADPCSEAARLAHEVVRFEERNLEMLKRYL